MAGPRAGLHSRRRVIAIVAGVGVAALAAGMVLAQLVVSPGEAAARTAPPEPSLITAAVEMRALTSEVVVRGDAVHDGAVDLVVEVAGSETPPIVTGQLPPVGGTLEAGDVALEVAGRPVVVLPGDLPTYRTLAPGSSGPDVAQLKAALDALGLSPGDVDDDRYDAETSEAVAALYERIGYPAPPLPEDVLLRLEAARDTLEAADAALRGAEQVLTAASRGPGKAERLAADASVAAAERALEQAQEPAEGDGESDDDGENGEIDEHAVAAAEEQLAIARAQRDDLLAPQDTSAEQEAVAAARAQRDQARDALASAEADARTRLPAAEVVFVGQLPMQVVEVLAERGAELDGPALRLTGTGLVVVASLSVSDAALVTEAATAMVELDGDHHPATVSRLQERSDGTTEAVVTLDEPEEEVLTALQGRNVRVIVPVEATDGEVLAVPLAALTAGASSDSRVQVERGDGEVELVAVDVGLAAGGFAEVEPLDGTLEPGDRVVVGR